MPLYARSHEFAASIVKQKPQAPDKIIKRKKEKEAVRMSAV
jgi:hypothetical protein